MPDFYAEIISLVVTCDRPDMNMYRFNGHIIAKEKTGDTKEYPLNLQNFIPRGSVVGNSEMYAIVVYTGADSKIILNQGKYSYKSSSIEKKMNLIYLF